MNLGLGLMTIFVGVWIVVVSLVYLIRRDPDWWWVSLGSGAFLMAVFLGIVALQGATDALSKLFVGDGF